MSVPAVSVVIPTRGRPQLLLRAVASVLAQTLPELEVLVVVDGPDPETVAALGAVADPRVRVIQNEASLGGGEARNLGVRAARAPWVAFLDDDDEWLPQKLERQLALAGRSAYPLPIVSCLLIARSPRGDSIWPRRTPRPGEPVGDYLFVREGAFQGETMLQTSTLMAPTALALRVPFEPALKRHQDWDWLLRATDLDGVGVLMVDEPLSVWSIEDDRDSVSRRNEWEFSLGWISAHRDRVGARAFAGFIATQIAPQAAREGSLRTLVTLLREMLGQGSPRFRDLALLLAMWFVPRGLRRRVRLRLTGRGREAEG